MKTMDASDSGKTFEDDFTIDAGKTKKFYILCQDEIGNEMDSPEVVEITRTADDTTTPSTTNPGTGFFSENMAAIQIAIIFVLIVAAIGIVGFYFWKQNQ